jgi:uncharacterized protein (DUF2147 family)
MRTIFVIAAFMLASTAAQAQYTFDYGGRTITIDPDRGTVSIPGVYDNTGKKAKRSRDDQDSDRSRKQPPQQAKNDPQAPAVAPAPAPPAPAPAPATTAAEPAPAPAAAAPATAAVAPAATATQPPASAPAPQAQPDPPAAAAAPPAPAAPTVATRAAPVQAPAPKPQAAVPAAAANSPLGVWLTEEKEGKVRIEQCGPNLCGYSVDAKSNQNGEQVLINMKPAKDSKWSGRILDPSSGSTYDSTIALKGSDQLRVQGCAFGGMFCGGQTWSRLN